MEMGEKIFQIRKQERMTREEFSREIDVPLNTLKSLEQRGGSPRAEVLEKIAGRWPRYAEWLLTGKDSIEKLISRQEEKRYRIIDIATPSEMDGCIVKPKEFSKLIFVVEEENDWRVAALLVAGEGRKNQPMLGVPAVWLTPTMSFRSTGGGRNRLRELRRWVMLNNSDLTMMIDIRRMEKDVMDNVENILTVPGSALKSNGVDQSDHVDSYIYGRFLDWSHNLGDYKIEPQQNE